MTIKGSLHPLPSEHGHCGSQHRPGLRRNYRVGFPEKQVLALFVQPWTPAAQPELPSLALPGLSGPGLQVLSTGTPPQCPSSPREGALERGRGPLLGVLVAAQSVGMRRLLLLSQQLKLAVQVQGHCSACIVWEPRDTRRGGPRGLGAAPRDVRGVLGPRGGPGGFKPQAVPRRGGANRGTDVGAVGKPGSYCPPQASCPRLGNGGKGAGETTQVGC